MENTVGRRLALLAGWGAALLYILDSRTISSVHAPTFFLFGVVFGPFCAWGAMLAADYEKPGAGRFKLSSSLEFISAFALGFFLLAFALSWVGIPGL